MATIEQIPFERPENHAVARSDAWNRAGIAIKKEEIDKILTRQIETYVVKQDYPSHIRVDGIVYDLHFTADGDYTFCVMSVPNKNDPRLYPTRYVGMTYRNPKDPPDPERSRHEAFCRVVFCMVSELPFPHDLSTMHPGWEKELYDKFRRAYWKACQKLKEQK
jgi:hypothetical protein